MSRLTVSTPGKLILMGEHAVVYGHPALVAAVELRLRASVSPREPSADVRLSLPQLRVDEEISWAGLLDYARTARSSWRAYAAEPGAAAFARLRRDDPAHVVKVALGEAALHMRASPEPVALALDSRLPMGSGFGSSAAVAVAVVAAAMAWWGEPWDEARIESIALEVERRQHGFPSGVDAATVLRGGLVWAERRQTNERLVLSPLTGSPPDLDRFRIFDTGAPAQSTGAVVAAVRERVDAEPERFLGILEEMGETTRAFKEALLEGAEPERLIRSMRSYESGLEALGVVPSGLAAVVRQIEDAGGAAKISGAGALDPEPGTTTQAGVLLAYHPEPDRLAALSGLAAFRRHRVRLGGVGLRLERS